MTAHSMGCDGNGVGGSMELLKAFKSPSSVSTGKKNLLSTYSKILFRFNFLRLPSIEGHNFIYCACLSKSLVTGSSFKWEWRLLRQQRRLRSCARPTPQKTNELSPCLLNSCFSSQNHTQISPAPLSGLPPIISPSNRFTRANETSVPQTWCSAPST